MSVGCIQVLYNPNIIILEKSINNILKQVDFLVIVDNSPKKNNLNFTISSKEKIVYIFNNDNLGIAEAQNIGIKELKRKGCDFVYFTDQDSIPPNDIITKLLSDYNILENLGYNVGAIGPTVINRQNNKPYKARINKGTIIDKNITQVTELISSGTLTKMNILDKVGYMESSLFIDGVDHEWCWRANNIGNYKFFITSNAKLSHQLGEGDHHFLGIDIAISTPFRSYYQFRNFIILCRRKYVPFYWKFSNGIKYFIKLFYYPLFVSPRLGHIKRMYKGIIDGIGYKKE